MAKNTAKKINDWLIVKNESAMPAAEMLIYNRIGKDWTGEDGLAAKDFDAALKAIPPGRPINVRINSVGGNVWDGLAIHNMLAQRRADVTCHNDGIAASIAAVIMCAGSRAVMPKNSLMMIHPAQGMVMGDEKAMRAGADKLATHTKSIASVYAEKTGKSQEEIINVLNQGEKWMTGEEAKEFGLCDDCTDAIAISNEVNNFDFSRFQHVPEVLQKKSGEEPALNNGAAQSGVTLRKDIMNKEAILALLRAHGQEVANDASDEAILAALNGLGAKAKAATSAGATPPQNIIDLENSMKAITTQLANERKTRIEAVVNGLVNECRITREEVTNAVKRAIADETYLDELRARPPVIPGNAPVGPAVSTLNDSTRNVMNEVKKNVSPEGAKGIETASIRSQNIQQVWLNERAKILPVLNAAASNAIDSTLKRVLILQETVRDFAIRMLPIRLFSTVFNNVPLQGTDQVIVPYYPLQTTASSTFTNGDGTGGTGYQFGQGTNTQSKTITVSSRKYQPLDYSSYEFRRQPWFDAVKLGRMNAEKLGVDVLTDVLSVINPTNFTNTNPLVPVVVKNIPAAGYSSDDVVGLRGAANLLYWPDVGRSLIVDSTIDVALSKDPSYKLALNIGTTAVIQEGRFPNLSGFEYAWMPNFPSNGINLLGAIAHASGILAAFAPIDPAPGVRAQLIAYEIATDAMTGISLNYRHWGLAQADRDYEVIECAYGYTAGVQNAIRMLTHP